MFFMRAGPLSDPRVIDLLNHRYVPVSISNDAYTREEIPAAERELKQRIVRESWKIKDSLRTGEDALYVLDPDGKVVGAIRAPESIQIDHLLPFLKGKAEQLNMGRGDPLVKPTSLSVPPKTNESDLVL